MSKGQRQEAVVESVRMPGLRERAVLEARAQAPGKRPPAVAHSTVLRP